MGASEKDQIAELIDKLATERSAELIETARKDGYSYSQAVREVTVALGPLFRAAGIQTSIISILNAELENALVEELHLTVRAYNCLKREGIHNLLQLTQMSYRQLMDIRNFGESSIIQVQAALQERGLSLIDFPAEKLGLEHYES
jgi:DNA-directed RNA polymerase alpha subunit